ncbi:MAG: glutathione S-transferase [Pseudomonadota bacterium]
MADLRIFSYLPNPRVFKATIAARYAGSTVEVVGGKPIELIHWLWDYEARPLSTEDKNALSKFERIGQRGFVGQSLYKTNTFLQTNPFGDVPAAFGNNGALGLFESNSIMRAAARLGPDGAMLYGDGDPLLASRIDGFLDRTLIFATTTQRYLLALSGELSDRLHGETRIAFDSYLSGIEQALSVDAHIAGADLSLADIAFACELCLLSNEVPLRRKHTPAFDEVFSGIAEFPRAHGHLIRLLELEAFSKDLSYYREHVPELA